MADRVLNRTQYAEYLGLTLKTFSYLRSKNPETFAPSFVIGNREKWYLSTIDKFHHDNEVQRSEPINGKDIEKQTGGEPIE